MDNYRLCSMLHGWAFGLHLFSPRSIRNLHFLLLPSSFIAVFPVLVPAAARADCGEWALQSEATSSGASSDS